jgi:hypothetical protein
MADREDRKQRNPTAFKSQKARFLAAIYIKKQHRLNRNSRALCRTQHSAHSSITLGFCGFDHTGSHSIFLHSPENLFSSPVFESEAVQVLLNRSVWLLLFSVRFSGERALDSVV